MRKQSLSQLKYGSSSGKSGEPNGDDDKENAQKKAKWDAFGVKRDFFGRIINESLPMSKDGIDQSSHNHKPSGEEQEHKVWVTFHEGFSNAVRKPISLGELLAEL
jgi:chromosome transmission fidelity protein 18